jgi:hypothetical protein
MMQCMKMGNMDMKTMCMFMDCMEMCQMCANGMMRMSPMTGKMCQMCATMCESMSGNPMMMRCAEMCRRCAESCSMTAKAMMAAEAPPASARLGGSALFPRLVPQSGSAVRRSPLANL